MKIIKLKEKKHLLKLEPQTIEDLWYLAKIIEAGDVIAAQTLRRFKARKELGRADSGEKKKVFIELRVESAEFAEAVNKLRVTGKILRGEPEEFVALGEHHTIDVELGKPIELIKELSIFHKKVLEEAIARSKKIQATIVLIDDEKALFARLNPLGIEFLYEVWCKARKSEPKTFEELKKKFFAEVLKGITSEASKGKTIIAGPGFTREEFKKFISQKNPELLKRTCFETASNTERSALFELLKKGVLQRLIGEQKLSEEFAALEEFKKRIAHEGLACYGFQKVFEAVQANAVEKILVIDELLRKDKEVQELVKQAEAFGGKTLVFDSEDAAGKEFKSFGTAAFLRYKP